MKKISALFLSALLGAGAQAATVSSSAAADLTATDFGVNSVRNTGVAPLSVSLDRFDRHLGELQSVLLTVSANVLTDLLVKNTGTSGKSVGKVSLGVDIFFTSSLGVVNTRINGTDTDPVADLSLETPKRNFSLNPNQSLAFTNQTASDFLTFEFTDRASLDAFTSLNPAAFNIACSTLSMTNVSYTGGNAEASQSTKAACGADVVYTYDDTKALPPSPNPTPEPASLALVGLGLIGVAASRKKSRKA
ncbi:choice-of-anchor E domain-containing protein [Azohydromonas caseinilytica]|uniref:Choice-of-anchor E domain-containing protein n=1 Tax=Azohydromonas caseinilytica TaxID=2728836 RepID=A0A848F6P7_9BURK|nr:choice-of-anchor E domain-containing protein [Azohydromonas caseinilytica]NML15254.1 choice-of-anchor E domain-containing protein [Azohydromonas caseinilytica]